MSKTAAIAKSTLLGYLQDPAAGVNAQLAGIESRDGVVLPRISTGSWFTAQVRPALLDANADRPNYPRVLVYLDGQVNRNLEKFRYFAGEHRVVVEVQLSDEGFKNFLQLEANLDRYVEAVLNVIQAKKQNWSPSQFDGVVYNGLFDVAYSAIEISGANFLQLAHIGLKLVQYTG